MKHPTYCDRLLVAKEQRRYRMTYSGLRLVIRKAFPAGFRDGAWGWIYTTSRWFQTCFHPRFLGEMIQLDEQIFQMGGKKPPPRQGFERIFRWLVRIVMSSHEQPGWSFSRS